jgi:hypothetical protein
MDAIPPISSGLPPVMRATRPPVKRVERIARERDRPPKDGAQQGRGEPGSGPEPRAAPGRQDEDGDERPRIDIRV